MTMMTYTQEELKVVLEEHRKWLLNKKGGVRANLTGANLTGANLTGANLTGANLTGANLTRASLYEANLTGANLTRASLYEANLTRASLYEANLTRANLTRANLTGANLTRANLTGANLPSFQIPQEGELIVFKKLARNIVCKLRIPPEAKRTASLIGRKCRAEFAEVLEGSGPGSHDSSLIYTVGEIVRPDSYDPDIRVECSHGIHFFLTHEEAKDWA